jgi:hypothetical protein
VTRSRLRLWAMGALLLALVLFLTTVQVLRWAALVLVLVSILALTWTLLAGFRSDVE